MDFAFDQLVVLSTMIVFYLLKNMVDFPLLVFKGVCIYWTN